MKFSALNLPPLPTLQKSPLVQLSESFGQKQHLLPPGVPRTTQNSPRSLEEIIANLEENQTDQISQIERVYLLDNKASYDQKFPQNKIKTSQLIWNFARTNSSLKRLLIWNLVLFYGKTQNSVMAASLVETFPPNLISNTTPKEIATSAIIKALQQTHNVAEELARLSFNYKNSPKTLLQSHQLPYWIPQIQEALNFVAQFFPSSPTPQQESWFMACLNQMTAEQQMKATESLLKRVAAEKAANLPNLVAWLKHTFDQKKISSRWQQLSNEGKILLRKWIGAANYRDFEKLVDLLLRQKTIEQLDIPVWEAQQLRSRKAFWANYSDRFEQIRILLPQRSMNALGYNLFQNVEILKEDGSDTEVCIFDFGDWFIVEFFRGRGSETRFFSHNYSPNILQKLMEEEELSVKYLRSIKPIKVHDHLDGWKSDCQLWLTEHNILPNQGSKMKLDPLPYERQQRREQKIKNWQRDIQQLEAEAQEYIKRQGLSYKI